MGSVVGLVLIACVYLVPTWIGLARRVSGVGVLALVNVFLGWSVLGWACCLYMACVAGDHPVPRRLFWFDLRLRPRR